MGNKFIYAIKDCTHEENILALLAFREELTREKRIEIQNKIDEIKNNTEDYQTDEIIEQLHEYYTFYDLYVEYGEFYI